MGVDSYSILGLIPVNMNALSGEFLYEELKYELAGHAWLMIQDEDGRWYGLKFIDE